MCVYVCVSCDLWCKKSLLRCNYYKDDSVHKHITRNKLAVMEWSVCARLNPAACLVWARNCLSLFGVGWRYLRHRPSCFAQRGAAPRQTRLLLPCPAPGRHPASPSHFNYGLALSEDAQGKRPHTGFIERPTHTLPKKVLRRRNFSQRRRGFIWETRSRSKWGKNPWHRRGP